MKNKDLIQRLKQDAISKGLCLPWQSKFNDDLSIRSLIKMYIKGIDFCISEDYPTLGFLRGELKGKCEQYGVFIDDKVKECDLPDIVLNGTCEAELSYTGFAVSRIYARHDSKVNITTKENAYLTIDCFDNSVLNITANDTSKVIVSQYGNSKVSIGGNVIVKQMYKDTY